MSEKNAKKYAMNNLNPDGIAVLNVGDTSGYEGDVFIFKKSSDGTTIETIPTYYGVLNCYILNRYTNLQCKKGKSERRKIAPFALQI